MDEKVGGRTEDFNFLFEFRKALEDNELIDLGWIGSKFVWTNKYSEEGNVMERLDRWVANNAWKDLFPDSFIHHLTWYHSDHNPIIYKCSNYSDLNSKKKKKKIFKFEVFMVNYQNMKK